MQAREVLGGPLGSPEAVNRERGEIAGKLAVWKDEGAWGQLYTDLGILWNPL